MISRGPLKYEATKPGQPVKPGTTLRILGVGDSITVGFLSDLDGGDGNGYRLKLRQNLSRDCVAFAGTESVRGTIPDNNFAAWNGRTIQFISDNIEASLNQRPNVVLVHAGTNDMNPNLDIATEGNDPKCAAERLGQLIDQIVEACPDATVLVAMIINTLDEAQQKNIIPFQRFIPGIVASRAAAGKHVLTVNFTTFPTSLLRDGVHPTNEGYRHFGDYWYDFITQIPKEWLDSPVGGDRDSFTPEGKTEFSEPRPENVSWPRRILNLLCLKF
ncbi:bkrf1 encodes ebna-1 protein [Colletotrichum truncatum]|uniref:Bkrf1 encodes ebna-1 protein n=1 Tax=Colletotrichum truncatum TaxID=5467 RepID=A0ACC3YZ00_COLTU|nr:bkrf1 encodes ebna-1 protein [Colletotrichum truncatum]KAF6786348.1 bkrf1 encodes ebna-1 protein [Colletotrichum truncatum]